MTADRCAGVSAAGRRTSCSPAAARAAESSDRDRRCRPQRDPPRVRRTWCEYARAGCSEMYRPRRSRRLLRAQATPLHLNPPEVVSDLERDGKPGPMQAKRRCPSAYPGGMNSGTSRPSPTGLGSRSPPSPPAGSSRSRRRPPARAPEAPPPREPCEPEPAARSTRSICATNRECTRCTSPSSRSAFERSELLISRRFETSSKPSRTDAVGGGAGVVQQVPRTLLGLGPRRRGGLLSLANDLAGAVLGPGHDLERLTSRRRPGRLAFGPTRTHAGERPRPAPGARSRPPPPRRRVTRLSAARWASAIRSRARCSASTRSCSASARSFSAVSSAAATIAATRSAATAALTGWRSGPAFSATRGS